MGGNSFRSYRKPILRTYLSQTSVKPSEKIVMNMSASLLSEITVVTYATKGRNVRYRDYSESITRLSSQCEKLGLGFKDVSDLVNINFEYSKSQPYHGLRKGAGYWSWKPKAIFAGMAHVSTRYILYVDADVHIFQVPFSKLINSVEIFGMSLYLTNEKLKDWTSPRCLKLYSIDDNSCDRIYSASAIFLDKQSKIAISALKMWEVAIQDYRQLLDPFWSVKLNHRHDQSIISCMIASERIKVGSLPLGFYQGGVDNGDVTISNSWMATGIEDFAVLSNSRKHLLHLKTFLFHKFQLGLYLFRLRFFGIDRQ